MDTRASLLDSAQIVTPFGEALKTVESAQADSAKEKAELKIETRILLLVLFAERGSTNFISQNRNISLMFSRAGRFIPFSEYY